MGRGPDKKPRKKRTDGQVPPPNFKGRNRPTGLPKGTVSAIRASKRRIPEDATEQEQAIAAEAFDRIVSVMRGEVSTVTARRREIDAETGEVLDEGETVTIQSPSLVLQAARMVRDDVCVPHAQRVEVGVDEEIADLIRNGRLRARQEDGDDV